MNKKEEIKLSQYAKENNLPYKKCWQMYKDGVLPVKTITNEKNRVFVVRETNASISNSNLNMNGKFAKPDAIFLSKNESFASTRRNKAATSIPTDQYSQIKMGVSPYIINGNNFDNSNISISEAIKLCQLCYYNFSIFRNTIDLMTEFSTNKIFLRGGNLKARNFIHNWLESINYLNLQDQFFREYYRSGNVFIQKFQAKIKDDDIKKLSKVYEIEAKSSTIPVRYIILNPTDITIQENISFSSPVFLKSLNSYELARLKDAKTYEEKAFLSSLPEDVQKNIKNGNGTILIPLNPRNIYAIFYKKQDYEPLAVPMAYPVLKDINWKAEMKAIDMAVARVMNNVVLLVKMGYESKNGEYMFDQQAAAAMKQLFESESVGKTLVADFTTEMEHKIPSIGDFLDPKKYTIVNDDIKTGLNYILGGGSESKFANQFIQTQIFVQRLQQAREVFVNEFLMPEIKKICESMNFKSYPRPYFEDFDLRDSAEFNRIIVRLSEIGFLTPEETFTAIDTGRIPTGSESEESQVKYKELKDTGYYEPIVGGPFSQKEILDKTNKGQLKLQESQQEHDDKQNTKQRRHETANPPPPPPPSIHIGTPVKQQAGKPTGKTGKQSTNRKSKPMSASIEDFEESENESYSLNKIKDNIIASIELKDAIESKFKEKFGNKELSNDNLEFIDKVRLCIMQSENVENWKSSIAKYIEMPVENEDNALIVDKLAIKHSVDPFLASILINSKKDNDA